MSKWRPIGEYDMLRIKPKNAVFYVEAEAGNRPYTALSATLSLERTMGRRTISKFIVLPDPRKEQNHEARD